MKLAPGILRQLPDITDHRPPQHLLIGLFQGHQLFQKHLFSYLFLLIIPVPDEKKFSTIAYTQNKIYILKPNIYTVPTVNQITHSKHIPKDTY